MVEVERPILEEAEARVGSGLLVDLEVLGLSF
jgi:hypothetical protein